MTAFSASICYNMPSWLVSIGDAISWGQAELEFRQWDELMERGATYFLKLDETGVSHGKTWSSQIAFLQDSLLSRRNKITAPWQLNLTSARWGKVGRQEQTGVTGSVDMMRRTIPMGDLWLQPKPHFTIPRPSSNAQTVCSFRYSSANHLDKTWEIPRHARGCWKKI